MLDYSYFSSVLTISLSSFILTFLATFFFYLYSTWNLSDKEKTILDDYVSEKYAPKNGPRLLFFCYLFITSLVIIAFSLLGVVFVFLSSHVSISLK